MYSLSDQIRFLKLKIQKFKSKWESCSFDEKTAKR